MKRFIIFMQLLTITFMAFVMIGCSSDNEEPLLLEKDLGVYSIKNQKELKEMLPKRDIFTRYWKDGIFAEFTNADVAEKALDSEDSAPTATPGFKNNHEYETNIQVEGVDEGDIVKVDGNYIYYISKNNFYVLKKNNNTLDTVTTLSQVKEDDYFCYASEVYYTDKYVVLISNGYRYETTIADRVISSVFSRETSWYTAIVKVTIYDKQDFSITKELELDGNLYTTRLVENNLYVVANYYQSYYGYIENDIRPVIKIDGEVSYPEYKKIKYLNNIDKEGYTVFFNIELEDEIKLHDYYFLGKNYYSTIYVSQNRFYLVNNNYNYVNDNQDYYSSKAYATITIFDIDPNTKNVVYGGQIEVDGHVNNQFWMDQKNNEIRIVTTGREDIRNGRVYTSNVFNYLYIIKRTTDLEAQKYVFEEVGSIKEGIGQPNESIKSARFDDDRVTIVTFRQTDPLYYIDLKDSTNPVITSELKVSGYSSYQHPYKDNYVIGIGYEADESGVINGLKLSLYDVSDQNNIKEVGNSLVFPYKQGYSYSDALNNHKAIMFDLSNNVFGFEITSSYYGNNGYNVNSYYYVYYINPKANYPISVLATIEYQPETTEQSYYKHGMINRMVFIDDCYYVLADYYVSTYKIVGTKVDLTQKLILE